MRLIRELQLSLGGSCLLAMSAYAIAGEVALSTFYPAPRAAYQELFSTGQSQLATEQGSRVGIGLAIADPIQAKLHIREASNTGQALRIETPTGLALAVTGSGYIGIRTDTPNSALTLGSGRLLLRNLDYQTELANPTLPQPYSEPRALAVTAGGLITTMPSITTDPPQDTVVVACAGTPIAAGALGCTSQCPADHSLLHCNIASPVADPVIKIVGESCQFTGSFPSSPPPGGSASWGLSGLATCSDRISHGPGGGFGIGVMP